MFCAHGEQTDEFRGRQELLKSNKRYNKIVATRGMSELWHVNALANRHN